MALRRMFSRACLALALAAGTPAGGQVAVATAPSPGVEVAAHVAEASQRFGIPERWIYAVMRTESAGRVDAVSSAGAMGLMQLMPATWARQRARFGLGANPFDPRDNVLAGTSYLREMYDRYGWPGVLAAYNAGPRRYEDWRDRGRVLPAETRAYVARIALMLQPGGVPAAVLAASPPQPARLPWTEGLLFARRGKAADEDSGLLASGLPPSAAAEPGVSPNDLFAPVAGEHRR